MYHNYYGYVSANSPDTEEYQTAMNIIQPIVDEHRRTLVKGTPQLNYCDPAVMVSVSDSCLSQRLWQ